LLPLSPLSGFTYKLATPLLPLSDYIPSLKNNLSEILAIKYVELTDGIVPYAMECAQPIVFVTEIDDLLIADLVENTHRTAEGRLIHDNEIVIFDQRVY
jgi:hypothetical protein